MDKIVHIGLTNDCGNLFCRIKINNGKLSITGVEGPKRNGDAMGSCGQIIMHQWGIKQFSDGWTINLMNQLRDIWDKWHLNDMRAGNTDQTKCLRDAGKYTGSDWYLWACEHLKKHGLYNNNGYVFGTKWLFEPLPKDVVDFLESLPESKITPTWC